MMALTDKEKIAHLLRRFGLGATPEEVNALSVYGVDGAFQYLLNYQIQDEGFPVSPWEAAWDEGNPDLYLDAFRPAIHWALRMVMTKRPLQEKLTLFWHNHFAISGTKVELGPTMLSYLEFLRAAGLGKFDDLLLGVSASPAMVEWLDMSHNQVGHPNENFGREVMELFTMGIGTYTEKDVQECARAFTGWGARNLLFEQGFENVQATARAYVAKGRPMVVFAYSPELHDSGPKTILGQTKNWTGDEVLRMLAGRPETARYLAKKMWSFFAYEDPEQAVIDRLAKVYMEKDHQIRPMLQAIYDSPEFWSEKCVRRQVKSPMDFTVAVGRQLGIGAFLATSHPPTPQPTKPLPKPMRDIGNIMFGIMFQQGMTLLFPPDVAGWKWGTAWITSDAMVKRSGLGPQLMGSESKDHGGAGALAFRIVSQGAPTTAQALVDNFLSVFDVKLPADKVSILVKLCEKAGGPARLATPETAAKMLAPMCAILFASPEFQFC